MTGTELRIWTRIRRGQLNGWRFRRQQPIGPYFVDFFCPAARLIIEVDGPLHDDRAAPYDERRQSWLECEGYKLLRIPVSAIDEDVHSVIEWIEVALDEQQRLGFCKQPLRRPAGDTSPPSGEEQDMASGGEAS